MKRGPTDHHIPNQDCSNCGQLGHPWFACPHIICDGCNQCGHIYRHCWDRKPPSGTASPPEIRDKGTHRTATELKADHPTGRDQVAIDHQLPMLGIVLEADHPHAAMRRHPDAV